MAGNKTLETAPITPKGNDPFENILGPTVIIVRPLHPLSERNLPTITTEEKMRQFLACTCKVEYLPSNISEDQLPVISDDRIQSLGVTENKMKMLKNALIGLKQFLFTPIVIDGWRDDYNARVESIKLLEKKYGDLFKKAYCSRNKLRINMLTEASTNIQMLAYLLRGNVAADSLREALESISSELKKGLDKFS